MSKEPKKSSAKLPVLYKRSAKGKVEQWEIIVKDDSFYTISGQLDGKLTETKPTVCLGKNKGKANATTGAEQALKEAKAKHDKKKDKGYCEDVDEIDDVSFEKPMKGDKWAEREDEVEFPVTIQDKINGVNFRIKSKGVESTGGKFYLTVPHIVESLAPLYDKYPDLVLVGEGYNPDARFLHQITEILTVNKGEKDLTPELLATSKETTQAWLFDGYGFDNITKNTPWLKRHAAVEKLVKGYKYVYMLPYEVINDRVLLMKRLAENKVKGGEGLMIRWGDCPVKAGKSKYLLKLKHMEDAEFKIIRVEEGKGDAAGQAARIILELPEPTKDRDGNILTEFASNIEGTDEWKAELFERREEVVGENASCRFQGLSAYGVPQIPYVYDIRTYE